MYTAEHADDFSGRIQPANGTIHPQAVEPAVACADDDLVFAILVQVLNQHGRRLGIEHIFPFLDVLTIAHAQADKL